jgi:hypothetical protein
VRISCALNSLATSRPHPPSLTASQEPLKPAHETMAAMESKWGGTVNSGAHSGSGSREQPHGTASSSKSSRAGSVDSSPAPTTPRQGGARAAGKQHPHAVAR